MKLLITLTIFVTFFPSTRDVSEAFAQANQPGSGNCLSFDGVDDRVIIPQSPPINFNYTNPFTFEAWVNVSNTGGEQRIINKQRNIINELHITLGIGPDDGINPGNVGRFYFKIGGQNIWTIYAYSTFVANANEYYHLAGVYDGTVISLYVNGVFQSSASRGANTTIVSSSDINCSRLYDATDYYNGLIDEVRIWNVARTQTEIRDNMTKKLTGTEPGLVGYWRMDEGSGTTVFDSSPNGNNGTLF